VHFVARGYFRSHDKDGGHTIRSALAETPMLHANLTAVCFIEAELLPIEVLHCGIREYGFSTFFAPVTLTLTRWLSYTHLTRIPSKCTRWAKINFLSHSFRQLSSDRHIYRQTDRQTDAFKIIHHAASWVVNKINKWNNWSSSYSDQHTASAYW